MRRWTIRELIRPRYWAPAVALTAFSCVSPPLESPAIVVTQETHMTVKQNVKNKVDVLFMVDNSNSMSSMIEELKNRFGQFFQVFQNLANDPMHPTYADLHIGVVTSDYGAGATGAPGCQPSPGGQQGKMQALGAVAPNGCQPPVGSNYIKYDFANNGKNNNLPAMQNLVQTFTCMASVGAGGCGFEHQLESVYAALHNNLAENKDFLRSDALLTVVFLTNEDDSSAPPDTDMFDKTKTAQYGYEDSYRQTRFGVVCGNPRDLTPYGDSGGPMPNCAPAPNDPPGSGPGKEYDVSRYINFFTKPSGQGGVKTSPADVILVGIDAPADPVQIILSNPGTPAGSAYTACSPLNEQSNPPCVPVLQHSCQNPQNPNFFGDPAVRLNTVINSTKAHKISSICDSDYTGALQDLAKLIVSQIGGGCITSKLPVDPATNMPIADCVVEDTTDNGNGTNTITEIPRCTANGNMPPCWILDTTKPVCKAQSPQGVGITVNRGGNPAPPNTNSQVSCNTIAG